MIAWHPALSEDGGSTPLALAATIALASLLTLQLALVGRVARVA